MSAIAIVCPHCPSMEAKGISHTLNCRCTHHHAQHVFGGGCRVKGCNCSIYDQRPISVPKTLEEPNVSTSTKTSSSAFALTDIDVEKLEEQTKTPHQLATAQEVLDKLRLAKAKVQAINETGSSKGLQEGD